MVSNPPDTASGQDPRRDRVAGRSGEANNRIASRVGVTVDTVRTWRDRFATTGADALSVSTVRRWLNQHAIKPWQHRCWIFIRDPDFVAKATRVLDLYAGIWDGQPLGKNDHVICADEKTSIQARCRCHPTLPPGVSRTMRINHEYDRGGALAYLAAYDVHRAHVTGLCFDTTGIDPFMELAERS